MQDPRRCVGCVSRVRVLAATLALAMCGGSRVSAGDDISLEWAVDAGCAILEAEIVKAEKPIAYRVTAILKATGEPQWEVGNVLEHDFAGGKERVGDRAVLFLFENDRCVHAVINLTNPCTHPSGKGQCLAVDRSGKGVVKPEELLARIRQRVEQGCKQNEGRMPKVCKDGLFAHFKGDGVSVARRPVFNFDDEDIEGHYSVLVPPDSPAEIEAAQDGRLIFTLVGSRIFAGQSFRAYWPSAVGPKLLAEHESALQEIVGRVRKTWKPGDPATKFASAGACVSSAGKFVAVVRRGIVSVVEVASRKTIYQSLDAPRHSGYSAIFSNKEELFAHLHTNGDVTVFNLAEKQVKLKAKFPWPLGFARATCHAVQFSFSYDSKYIALNMHSGVGNRGSALLVWRTDTGECVFTKSPKWEPVKLYRIRGFGPHSELLRYDEAAYLNLEKGRSIDSARTNWSLYNDHPASEDWWFQ